MQPFERLALLRAGALLFEFPYQRHAHRVRRCGLLHQLGHQQATGQDIRHRDEGCFEQGVGDQVCPITQSIGDDHGPAQEHGFQGARARLHQGEVAGDQGLACITQIKSRFQARKRVSNMGNLGVTGFVHAGNDDLNRSMLRLHRVCEPLGSLQHGRQHECDLTSSTAR